ncbi:MAG: Glu/Leu/Phe/Val dehydrogenase dimerization domain-containing protein [Candidatus Dojkabacteria bacterium]|nr:Glu/Leu/Phe/Val dehydrogenase dimerization domain-containing protein [Candidatus Dojkabacteria bacterium]
MNNIFELMRKYNCEEIYFKYDSGTKLRAIIAINSTKRGEMCSGGVRLRNYKNEDAALWDAFNLSLAMTQKCAAINANVGGGKAVIWNSKKEKTPKLITSFAKFMCKLDGRFRTAVDLGMDFEDGNIIKKNCPYIEGLPKKYGGLGTEGDTTAQGVIRAMKIGAEYLFGTKSLKDKTIAIQGLGNVGGYMVEFLTKEAAKLIVTDIDKKVIASIKKKYPKVMVAPPSKIMNIKCDIFSPCAIGGILNSKTISSLRCQMICGSANNQLEVPDKDIERLEKKKILYLPDYIVNAGGIIQAIVEMNRGTKEEAIRNISVIEKNIKEILEKYKNSMKNTLTIANELVERRLK